MIKTLTPSGQKTVATILKDLQYISGAALQPVYEYVGKKFLPAIIQLSQSSDAPKFFKLVALYGVGNLSIGAGELRDNCQDAKDVDALVKTLSPMNQEVAVKMIMALGEGFKITFPVVMSINKLLDSKLYDQLMASENKTSLAALADLYLNYQA